MPILKNKLKQKLSIEINSGKTIDIPPGSTDSIDSKDLKNPILKKHLENDDILLVEDVIQSNKT